MVSLKSTMPIYLAAPEEQKTCSSREYRVEVVKFIYFEKATKFCKISTLLLSAVHTDKSKVEISQNFVTFSEYMNFSMKSLAAIFLVLYIAIEVSAGQSSFKI